MDIKLNSDTVGCDTHQQWAPRVQAFPELDVSQGSHVLPAGIANCNLAVGQRQGQTQKDDALNKAT